MHPTDSLFPPEPDSTVSDKEILALTDEEVTDLIRQYCPFRQRIQELSKQIEEARKQKKDIDRLQREIAVLNATPCVEVLFRRLRKTVDAVARTVVFSENVYPKYAENYPKSSFYEDVVSESLEKLMDGICTFEGRSKVDAFIRKVVQHTAFGLIRKEHRQFKKKEQGEKIPDPVRITWLNEPGLGAELPDSHSTPEQAASIREIREIWENVSDHISFVSRHVMVCYDVEDLKQKEIATQIGRSTRTVRRIYTEDKLKLEKKVHELGITLRHIER